MTLFRADTANIHTVAWQGAIAQPLQIWDQTLRDGEQTPGVAFSRDEKLDIARALAAAGVRYVNAGFPAVSTYEEETVRCVAKLDLPVELGVTARLSRGDVDAAIRCGVGWVNMFASLSDWHLRSKLRVTEDDYLAKMTEAIAYAKRAGLRVGVAIEDATRTPLERLLRFAREAIAEGATVIRICDTMGVLVPSSSYGLIARIRKEISCTLVVHYHDDLGLATANTLMALEAGADGAEVTVCGLGERTGNTSLEQLAVALHVKYGRDVGIDLGQLRSLAALVSSHAGIAVADHEPIIGSHAFAHESGVHVAGLLAEAACYETFPPALVGASHRFVYGKHSGLTSMRHVLETHGRCASLDVERQLLRRVKAVGQARKGPVRESEILAWADQLMASGAAAGPLDSPNQTG